MWLLHRPLHSGTAGSWRVTGMAVYYLTSRSKSSRRRPSGLAPSSRASDGGRIERGRGTFPNAGRRGSRRARRGAGQPARCLAATDDVSAVCPARVSAKVRVLAPVQRDQWQIAAPSVGPRQSRRAATYSACHDHGRARAGFPTRDRAIPIRVIGAVPALQESPRGQHRVENQGTPGRCGCGSRCTSESEAAPRHPRSSGN